MMDSESERLGLLDELVGFTDFNASPYSLDPRTLVSPDLIPILRSGHAPSPQETAYINALSVKAETERLEHIRTVERLINRIGFLQNQEEIYASIVLSPIRKLPIEILSIVLTLSLTPNVNYFSIRSGDKSGLKSRAVELGLVCTHWRLVSLRTPQVWANLHVEIYADDPGLNAAIQMHLERSQSVPLYLDIYLRGPLHLQQYFLCSSPLQLLVSYCHQWGEVTLVANAPLFPRSFEWLMGCPEMPLLQQLDLTGCSEAANTLLPGLNVKFFKNAKRLERLCIAACYLDEEFPWTQLRFLDLNTSEGSNTVLRAVRLCGQGLEVAKFALPGSPVGNYTSFHSSALQHPDFQSAPFQLHPQLGHLGVMILARQISPNDNRCGFEGLSDILTGISCPKLNTLRLVSNVSRKVWNDECQPEEGEGEEQRQRRRAFWPQQDLIDFFRRSKCSLTSLQLKGLWISEVELLGLLKLPEVGDNLREMVVHELESNVESKRVLGKRFMEEMMFPRVVNGEMSSPGLLPRLRQLEIKLPSSHSYPIATPLHKMVTSRWHIDVEHRLESVHLILIDPDYVFALHEAWTNLQAEGLAIKIQTTKHVILGYNGEEDLT
ncbi:hypothetical protein E1B28_006522 [Marasmius oreades]|uniref:F-box domain-containing protein n=1 Tax=Marasmius oreades TaxID=181124 RepID=A0A9P7S6M4_9AGAR|nr:uncharacterized protein E1B28_006522 [Marasmius oreades]KAG7095827.1 hypothetical protein E1B28_006522 [Marasmius oreades]